jgi:hypothetical protein
MCYTYDRVMEDLMTGPVPEQAAQALREFGRSTLEHDILSCQLQNCITCRGIIAQEFALKRFGVMLHEISDMEEEFAGLSQGQRRQWSILLGDDLDSSEDSDRPEDLSGITPTEQAC